MLADCNSFVLNSYFPLTVKSCDTLSAKTHNPIAAMFQLKNVPKPPPTTITKKSNTKLNTKEICKILVKERKNQCNKKRAKKARGNKRNSSSNDEDTSACEDARAADAVASDQTVSLLPAVKTYTLVLLEDVSILTISLRKMTCL